MYHGINKSNFYIYIYANITYQIWIVSTVYWPFELTENYLITNNRLFKPIQSWSPFKEKVFSPLSLRYCTCKHLPLGDWINPKYMNTLLFVSYFTAASLMCVEVLVHMLPCCSSPSLLFLFHPRVTTSCLYFFSIPFLS